MPLSSYPVKSKVYIRPLSDSPAPKVAPEDIRSGPGIPPSFSSYGHGDATPIIHFRGDEAFTLTSNNKFPTTKRDFLRNGPITQIDDYYFGHWIQAGTINPPYRHNLIPKMPDVAYITGFTPLGLFLPSEYDTQVNLRVTPEIVTAVNPNKVGFYNSLNANNYSLLRRLMWDDANRYQAEAVEWIDFLAKKGFSIDTSKDAEIVSLGVRVDVGDKGYMAAYHPTRGYLVTYDDFHMKVMNLISRYGLSDWESVEAMKRADMLHEIGHRLGIGGDRASERLQGLFRHEFYSKWAERFKGTKWEKIYRALARDGMDYARDFSLSGAIWDEITANPFSKEISYIDMLVAKFEAEAAAQELEGSTREAYVNVRLQQTVGHLLGAGPSYRTRTISKSESDSSRKMGLEKLVEKLRKEAKELNVDEGEYISRELAKSPIKYIEKNKEPEKAEPESEEAPQETSEA